MNALFTELMCGIVAQWLTFWAVNQETMGSNPAQAILFLFVLFLLLTCLLIQQTLITVVFSNVLLKLQPSSH